MILLLCLWLALVLFIYGFGCYIVGYNTKYPISITSVRELLWDINTYFTCDSATRYYMEPSIVNRINAIVAQLLVYQHDAGSTK